MWLAIPPAGRGAGVISKYSKAPEATYYLLALMATKEKFQDLWRFAAGTAIDPWAHFSLSCRPMEPDRSRPT